MQRWIGISALAAILVGGCGTEPQPEVSGTWNLTARYGGEGSSCIRSGTLTLAGSGAAVDGTLEHEAECTEGGTPRVVPPETESVSATVEGRFISFTPLPLNGETGCAVLRFEGRVGDDVMFGTVETIPVFCQGTYTPMQGSWEAERQ
jgi:hypothetical protein